jgi:hypothetical protein
MTHLETRKINARDGKKNPAHKKNEWWYTGTGVAPNICMFHAFST